MCLDHPERIQISQAAERIETDFEKGFIMEEVMKFYENKVREMEGRDVVIIIVYRTMELRLLRRMLKWRLKEAGMGTSSSGSQVDVKLKLLQPSLSKLCF